MPQGNFSKETQVLSHEKNRKYCSMGEMCKAPTTSLCAPLIYWCTLQPHNSRSKLAASSKPQPGGTRICLEFNPIPWENNRALAEDSVGWHRQGCWGDQQEQQRVGISQDRSLRPHAFKALQSMAVLHLHEELGGPGAFTPSQERDRHSLESATSNGHEVLTAVPTPRRSHHVLSHGAQRIGEARGRTARDMVE